MPKNNKSTTIASFQNTSRSSLTDHPTFNTLLQYQVLATSSYNIMQKVRITFGFHTQPWEVENGSVNTYKLSTRGDKIEGKTHQQAQHAWSPSLALPCSTPGVTALCNFLYVFIGSFTKWHIVPILRKINRYEALDTRDAQLLTNYTHTLTTPQTICKMNKVIHK